MCAVCWTSGQVIPAAAVAGRYVWVNHLKGRRGSGRPSEPEPEQVAAEAPDEVGERVDA
jgi:hypothetical protein